MSDLPVRFQRKIDQRQDGCWLWTGSLTTSGYGQVMVDGKTHGVHRYIYMLFNGDVSRNLVCDHLCGVKNCVNPVHIEPVSHRENIKRALGRTVCIRGHKSNRDKYGSCIDCRPYHPSRSKRYSKAGSMSQSTERDKFMSKFSEDDNGCWIWQRFIDGGGYGMIKFNGKTTYAHRVAYLLYNGSLGDNMTIDHLCRVRSCVNPNHLELVTREENSRRGKRAKSV